MKRKTRFSPGGSTNPFQGDDIDPFSAVRDEEGNIKKGDIPEAEPREAVGRMEGLPAKQKSFKQAFAEAEDGSTFTWNGKSYKKEYAGSAKNKESDAEVRFGEQGPRRPGYELKDVRMRYQGDPDEYRYNTYGLLKMRGPELMKSYQPRRPEYTSADEATYTPGKTRGLTNTAQIPGAENRGESLGKTRAEQIQDDVSDNLGKIMAATGAAGLGALGKLKRARDAERALSKEAAKAFSKPQAREVGSKVPARASQASKERAEAMENAKPILQSRPDTKSSRASRTRRTEEDMGIEFSKGGSTASRRADGCAMRGKTRGKIY